MENDIYSIAALRSRVGIGELSIEKHALMFIAQQSHSAQPPIKQVACLVFTPFNKLHNIFNNDNLVLMAFGKANYIKCCHAAADYSRIESFFLLPNVQLPGLFALAPPGWRVSRAGG